MNISQLIRKRRSIRKFKVKSIPERLIRGILDSARWAPSGLNNQPWKFMVLSKKQKNSLAIYTHYAQIIKDADKLILTFLDNKASYNREKDLMAIGAAIQNMLLYIHSKGLGACWLGEILNKKKQIQKFLGVKRHLELEAVIALGYPQKQPSLAKRKKLKDLILR